MSEHGFRQVFRTLANESGLWRSDVIAGGQRRERRFAQLIARATTAMRPSRCGMLGPRSRTYTHNAFIHVAEYGCRLVRKDRLQHLADPLDMTRATLQQIVTLTPAIAYC
jgi:hypothetical protein